MSKKDRDALDKRIEEAAGRSKNKKSGETKKRKYTPKTSINSTRKF
jgi:hypothetical protein